MFVEVLMFQDTSPALKKSWLHICKRSTTRDNFTFQFQDQEESKLLSNTFNTNGGVHTFVDDKRIKSPFN